MTGQLTIGRKLTLGVMAAVVSLAILSFTALQVANKLGGLLGTAVNSTARKLELLGQTRSSFQELKHESMQAQIAFAIGDMERFSMASAKGRCAGCHQPEAKDETVKRIEALGRHVQEINGQLRSLVSDETTRKALESFESGAVGWVSLTKEYLDLASKGKFEAAHDILREKMFPILGEVETAAKTLADKESEALVRMNAEAQSQTARGRWLMLAVIGINLVACAGVLWLVFQLVATLKRIVEEMREGSLQVARAAGGISQSSHNLAQNASVQAAAMEKTSSATEEIHSMANRNREGSRQAAGLVESAQNGFQEANQALAEMQQAMGRIELSSGKISQIIKVIDGIAFQTNILALNAAVEAARAGTAGLGFAVVADEVRNLAQRCAQAAKDTTSLIEESIENSRQGKSKAERVAERIRGITEQSATIRKLVEEVTKGSEEQSAGMDDVVRSLAEMDSMTQQTASSAEQCASAGEELTAQSNVLKGLSLRLHAMVEGGVGEGEAEEALIV